MTVMMVDGVGEEEEEVDGEEMEADSADLAEEMEVVEEVVVAAEEEEEEEGAKIDFLRFTTILGLSWRCTNRQGINRHTGGYAWDGKIE